MCWPVQSYTRARAILYPVRADGDTNRRAIHHGIGFNISAVPYPRPITSHVAFPPEITIVTEQSFFKGKHLRTLPIVPTSLVGCSSHVKGSVGNAFPLNASNAVCARARGWRTPLECLVAFSVDLALGGARHPAGIIAMLRWLWPRSSTASWPYAVDAMVDAAPHYAEVYRQVYTRWDRSLHPTFYIVR